MSGGACRCGCRWQGATLDRCPACGHSYGYRVGPVEADCLADAVAEVRERRNLGPEVSAYAAGVGDALAFLLGRVSANVFRGFYGRTDQTGRESLAELTEVAERFGGAS